MVAFFEMIAAGFIRVFLWVNRFTLFGNSASILTNLRFLSRKVLLIGMIAFIVIYVSLMIAFFYYMIDSIVTVYNLVSSFLQKMQTMESGSTGTSAILQPFFLFLNASGFVSGFQAAFPFLASAVLFRLLSALYRLTLEVNRRLIRIGTDLIALITAA
jgi:hypothetical protein